LPFASTIWLPETWTAGAPPGGVLDGLLLGELFGELDGELEGELDGLLDGEVEGELEGEPEAELEGVVEGLDDPPQTVPFTANDVGAALAPLYVKFAPGVTVPPPATAAFHARAATVTFFPDWLHVPFQPDWSVWLPA
jgi:hypothetical protein